MTEPLLPPRVAEVVRLYRQGWTCAGIADHIGVSAKSVRTYANIARRAGVQFPRAPQTGGPKRRIQFGDVCRLAREGLKQDEIAAQLGTTQKYVSKVLIAMRAAGEPLPPGGRWPKPPAPQPEPPRATGAGVPAGTWSGILGLRV